MGKDRRLEEEEEKQEEAGMWERNETCGGVKRRLAQRKQGPQSDAEVYHIDIKDKGCRGGPANVTSKVLLKLTLKYKAESHHQVRLEPGLPVYDCWIKLKHREASAGAVIVDSL